jgi:hypothetical protein
MQEARSSRMLQQKEDSILRAAGFEPTDGGIWQKNGVLFGREAALQCARHELRDSGEPNHFDEEA